MAYVLAVTWVAKPGNEAEVRGILQQMGEASRREPGVITYTTHENPDNPREFFIYEKYHDAAGLEEDFHHTAGLLCRLYLSGDQLNPDRFIHRETQG